MTNTEAYKMIINNVGCAGIKIYTRLRSSTKKREDSPVRGFQAGGGGKASAPWTFPGEVRPSS